MPALSYAYQRPPELTLLDAPAAPVAWVRGQSGCLINIGRADRITLRKVGEDEHEVRAIMSFDGREVCLFRGTFADAGDVMAQLGDALAAHVPTTIGERS